MKGQEAVGGRWGLWGSPCLGKDAVESEAGNALEVPKISSDKLEVVVDGCCGNLQVCIRKDDPRFLQMRSDFPEDPCGGDIVGEHSHSRKDAVGNVVEMAVPGHGTVSALIKLSDDHSTCELLLPGNHFQPVHVGNERSRSK